jgi:ParB/RepB/Spo0J family partition protein
VDVINVKINKLNPAEYNPRNLTDEQKDNIKKSLDEFGFVNPLVVNSNPDRQNIVIGGHQRLKVAQELGYNEVPVVYINLNEAQERELNIRLNRNTGEWDLESLAEHFTKGQLSDWGFDNEELSVIYTNTQKTISTTSPSGSAFTDEVDLGFEEDFDNKMVIIVFYNEQKWGEYQQYKKQYDGEEADLVYESIKQYYA